MTDRRSVKIMLVTHKPCEVPKCSYVVPVHAGRDVALEASKDGKINSEEYEWLIKNTTGDNTGDNISTKNRYYNEVSAIYWAWKNYDKLDNPDYIGLMHYRRHFIFNDKYYKKNYDKANDLSKALSVINENFITDKYSARIGLNEANIQDAIANSDVILSYPAQLDLYFPEEYSSIRVDYGHNIKDVKYKDFDMMVDLIKAKYPECIKQIDEYINGYNKYMYQMFIMRRDIFFKYCEFLFDILFKIENQVDFSTYKPNGKRSLGYLAEIMLTLFFIVYDPENKLKKLERGITFVYYPDRKEALAKIAKTSKYAYLSYLKYKGRYLLTVNKKERDRLKDKYKQAKIKCNFIKIFKKEFK